MTDAYRLFLLSVSRLTEGYVMDVETTKKIEWYESRIARRWPDQEIIDRAPIDIYDFIEVMKSQTKRIAELEARLGDLAEVR